VLDRRDEVLALNESLLQFAPAMDLWPHRTGLDGLQT
jgi:hypothetical protein